jgi:hypothetical protein
MMFFDWSLAQNEWTDEQKTVWANIQKMWRNFDHINWNIIQNSQEWKKFANQSISNTFNTFANDAIRIKAWRLINLFMAMFPDFDVYSHNFNNGAQIVFGRKEQNQAAGRVWFILEKTHQYRRIFISSSIAGNTETLEIDPDNLQSSSNPIIELLRKQNHTNNQTYGNTLAQLIIKYSRPNNRECNLPVQYTLSKDSWTWNIINAELKDCNTWQAISNSKVWKEGFAGTVADGVFTLMANDDTRFKIWGIMCAIATQYDLDIFYHAGSKKIAVGRKDLNKKLAKTTPFTITASVFHKGDNQNDADGNPVLNGTIKFDSITDATSLQNWLEDKNSDFPKDLSKINVRSTKTIYLPSDFNNKTDESDSEEDTETSNYSTALPQYPLNVIFYGPPGTGKTYTTIERAMRICEGQDFDDSVSREELVEQYQVYIDIGRIVFTTFHQSYSYEDFIEGIRATTVNSNIAYNVRDGVFKELCENAYNYPDEKFVIVIDEINRGNISRIFGELITLIEDSKRKGELEAISVKLPYSRDSFSVPKNVYIIGTMNTADRSLAGLDLALRRRFDFKEMMPDVSTLNGIKVGNIEIDTLLTVINQRIEVLLDREHTIGHAYFIGLKSKSSITDLASIFKNKVIPLLQEYFYEDWEKINMVLGCNDFITKKPINSNLFSKSQNDSMQLNSKTIWSISGDNVFENAEQYIRIYAPQNNGT